MNIIDYSVVITKCNTYWPLLHQADIEVPCIVFFSMSIYIGVKEWLKHTEWLKQWKHMFPLFCMIEIRDKILT